MPKVMQPSFFKNGPASGLRKITVRQKYSNHTLVFLDFDFTNKRQYILPEEHVPVHVRWGESPLGLSTFYGYVNHYETVTDRKNSHALTRMVLIGTSFRMNSSIPTNWGDTTRSAVAREIAKRHKMRSIVHEHPFTVQNWASGNRTDFQVLKALADESGYRLWVDGSTLYFLDPQRIITTAQTFSIPEFRRNDILDIQITGGSNAPTESGVARRRVIYGLDQATNQFFVATGGDPNQPVEVVNASANTYDEAGELTSAGDRRDDEYFTARATLRGNARVNPGSVINLAQGTVNLDQGGLWVVNEAHHIVTPGDFTTQVVATRGVGMRPNFVTNTTVHGMSEFAPAVVRDGKNWEAQLQEHMNA